ncbi:hypothetical protein GQ54DRAFT_32718 [Martensiomyces pterosporus]|nr:hypothetical protein GQ54DRAFT_32718 [Martensiomyces pterosporus]
MVLSSDESSIFCLYRGHFRWWLLGAGGRSTTRLWCLLGNGRLEMGEALLAPAILSLFGHCCFSPCAEWLRYERALVCCWCAYLLLQVLDPGPEQGYLREVARHKTSPKTPHSTQSTRLLSSDPRSSTYSLPDLPTKHQKPPIATMVYSGTSIALAYDGHDRECTCDLCKGN